MKCREFVEFIIDYLDGELPADQAAVFEEHMHLCPPCIEYLETYRTSVKLTVECCRCGDDVPPEVPEKLVQAILAARREQK